METVDRLGQKNWGKLTDVDLEQISGKREKLAAKIQEAYGITKREADKQIWDWGKSVDRVPRKIA